MGFFFWAELFLFSKHFMCTSQNASDYHFGNDGRHQNAISRNHIMLIPMMDGNYFLPGTQKATCNAEFREITKTQELFRTEQSKWQSLWCQIVPDQMSTQNHDFLHSRPFLGLNNLRPLVSMDVLSDVLTPCPEHHAYSD